MDQGEIDNPEDAVGLLQAIYRNPQVALPVRMRAAIEAAQYERPKLAVTAVSNINGKDFAAMLERAVLRSRAPLQIEHREAEQELPPSAPPGIRGRSGAR
jgi:hypothetical protein